MKDAALIEKSFDISPRDGTPSPNMEPRNVSNVEIQKKLN
jgi:hypothetical protein